MTPIDICSASLNVQILPLGATLASVQFNAQGRNLVLGFTEPEYHQTVPIYAGALVGPVANRVSDGRVIINDVPHQMVRDLNAQHALHSGPVGLHTQLWSVQAQTQDQVVMSTHMDDGIDGLPGKRVITAIYTVNGSTLTLEIMAKTDRTTPMNIASHPYWNLDGHADVRNHSLHVQADQITETHPDNIPTGRCISTAGTIYDFETPQPVPLDPALDVNFCLSTANRATPTHAATLKGADGTQLDIATTAPGLQVYNGAYLPEMTGVLMGAGDLHPFGGIALEPQYWPDAPHQPAFPDILLHPHDNWRQITIYTLTQAKI